MPILLLHKPGHRQNTRTKRRKKHVIAFEIGLLRKKKRKKKCFPFDIGLMKAEPKDDGIGRTKKNLSFLIQNDNSVEMSHSNRNNFLLFSHCEHTTNQEIYIK